MRAGRGSCAREWSSSQRPAAWFASAGNSSAANAEEAPSVSRDGALPDVGGVAGGASERSQQGHFSLAGASGPPLQQAGGVGAAELEPSPAQEPPQHACRGAASSMLWGAQQARRFCGTVSNSAVASAPATQRRMMSDLAISCTSHLTGLRFIHSYRVNGPVSTLFLQASGRKAVPVNALRRGNSRCPILASRRMIGRDAPSARAQRQLRSWPPTRPKKTS